MKELMKSNIYDVEETIIVVGSCLKNMQLEGYEKLQKISTNIYELCLEEIHINMAITKIGGMLRTNRIKKIIFASVDKSPHCIQLHYIQDELRKMLNLSNIEIENYVIVDNELKKISTSTISLSKNLSKLSNLNTEGK
ncbi:conserved domain protein [Clostridium sp. CAG:273]|nr:conserved domain protein [Clostridium sp. CAG:273]